MQYRLVLTVLTASFIAALSLCSCSPGTGPVEPPPAGGTLGDGGEADPGAAGPTATGEDTAQGTGTGAAETGDEGAVEGGTEVDPSMVSASVGDTVEISIFREGRLDRTGLVDSDGTVNLPLVGRVVVKGLNKYQIEDLVAKRYEEDGFLKNPVVTAEIRSRRRATNMASIFVGGQVGKQAHVPVPPGGRIGVLEAISAAGGLSDVAAKTRIRVTRTDPATGRKNVFKVNYDRIASGRQDDVDLLPGDIVYVPESIF